MEIIIDSMTNENKLTLNNELQSIIANDLHSNSLYTLIDCKKDMIKKDKNELQQLTRLKYENNESSSLRSLTKKSRKLTNTMRQLINNSFVLANKDRSYEEGKQLNNDLTTYRELSIEKYRLHNRIDQALMSISNHASSNKLYKLLVSRIHKQRSEIIISESTLLNSIEVSFNTLIKTTEITELTRYSNKLLDYINELVTQEPSNNLTVDMVRKILKKNITETDKLEYRKVLEWHRREILIDLREIVNAVISSTRLVSTKKLLKNLECEMKCLEVADLDEAIRVLGKRKTLIKKLANRITGVQATRKSIDAVMLYSVEDLLSGFDSLASLIKTNTKITQNYCKLEKQLEIVSLMTRYKFIDFSNVIDLVYDNLADFSKILYTYTNKNNSVCDYINTLRQKQKIRDSRLQKYKVKIE